MEREPLLPTTGSHLRSLQAATERYQSGVIDAMDWLDRRRISMETAVTCRLGVVNEPIPGHEKYVGWLSIPYLSAAGEAVSMRFRCLQDHDCRDKGHGKYMTLPGDQVRLYGVKSLTTIEDALHVCEGEIDAMILQQCGLPAVGAPGASTWQERHDVAARGFNAVYAWGDGDAAGREFSLKLYQRLDNVRIVTMPDGQDVNALYLREGEAGVRRLMQEADRAYGEG